MEGKKPLISIIVAVAENNAIGKDNRLLWHLPDDLKRFKKLTTGHTVIMGLRTYESLPVRPLPNRKNVVITDVEGSLIQGTVTVYSIEEALKHCDDNQENFVMGGGMIYRQFMDLADKIYITRIHHQFEADTFFPEINPAEWVLDSEECFKADESNNYDFSYQIFSRKIKP